MVITKIKQREQLPVEMYYLINEEKQKSQDPVHLTWIPCMHINMTRSIKQPSKVGACDPWWVSGAGMWL